MNSTRSLLVTLGLVVLSRAPAAETPPAAPAAGSPGVLIDHSKVDERLAAAIAAAKDPAVSPISVTDRYSINKVHRTAPTAPPAVHPGWTELHLVLDGSATFVTGGRLVPAADGKTGSGSIKGGVSRKITKGDSVIVPPNTPHWYQQIDNGGITVIEVRFVAPTPAAK